MALSKIEADGLNIGQIGGRRNLIINGAMQVFQRGDSADTLSNGDYTADRWRAGLAGLDGNLDYDKVTSGNPVGFANSLKFSMDASEASLDASDNVRIMYRAEGQDCQGFKKGTSSAEKMTVSFWAKSSVASTYTLEVEDGDNSRVIGKSYTIDTADTWQHFTLTFDGDTTGTLNNDNGTGFQFHWWIDAGSTYTSGTFNTVWQATVASERMYDTTGWLESTSPEFYLTGVQLEVGDTATPFEHRSYGEELALCQRYCVLLTNDDDTSEAMPIGARGFNTDQIECDVYFPVEMRTLPTLSQLGSGTNWRARYSNFNVDWTSFTWWTNSSRRGGLLYNGSLSGVTVGNCYRLERITSGAYLIFDAEL
jgi:hypothetical protein